FFFSLGGLRYALALPRIDAYHIAWYVDRDYDLIVTGRLIQPAEVRDRYTVLRLQVESVDTGDEVLRVRGLMLARIRGRYPYAYGDLLHLRGRLESPPEGELFSYRDYLARQGIYAYMRNAEVNLLGGGGNPLLRLTFAFRGRSLKMLYRFFPDPEASLLAGILLGDEGGLTEGLQRAFKVTGTSHIIAISGFNIAIIVALFNSLFGRLLGRRLGAAVAVIGVVFYTLLVGAGPSVVRAAIMGTLGVLAGQLYRRQLGLNTLTFTAALMALFSPFVLWDVSFQLSFFATLGLILFGTPLQEMAIRWLKRLSLPESWLSPAVQFLSDAVLLTLAAQITTLPIMAYHFQQISLIAFLANPFILPVQPFVMVLGGLSVLLGWIWLPVGQVTAWLAWLFPAYTIKMVELFSRFPNAILTLGRLPLWSVILYFAALLSWTLSRPSLEKAWNALRRWLPLSLSAAVLFLFVAALFIWGAVFALPDGRLHLTFLSVGSGDAILMRAPSGGVVLINGGPSANLLSQELGRRLLPWKPSLDWVIVASTQENQV
ncbi:MAG: ComEC/Rec2 family competence protein, partial [Anaerolineales bacterium]